MFVRIVSVWQVEFRILIRYLNHVLTAMFARCIDKPHKVAVYQWSADTLFLFLMEVLLMFHTFYFVGSMI